MLPRHKHPYISRLVPEWRTCRRVEKNVNPAEHSHRMRLYIG